MDKWLAPAFSNLSTDFSDCRVMVGSETFHCHKVILACASEGFKGMLLSNCKEGISGEIYLPNVKPDIFEKFRKYVYTYNTHTLNEYDNGTLMDLFEFGKQWLVPSITKECSQLLMERARSMKVEEVIDLYEFAHNYGDKQLIGFISLILAQQHSNQLLCDQVLLLGSDVFRQYMINVAISKPEVERFQIIAKFVEMNGFLEGINSANGGNNDVKPKTIGSENKKTISGVKGHKKEKLNAIFVKSLLQTIDYKKMTAAEFYRYPGKSELLTYKDKYEIIYRIFAKTCTVYQPLYEYT